MNNNITSIFCTKYYKLYHMHLKVDYDLNSPQNGVQLFLGGDKNEEFPKDSATLAQIGIDIATAALIVLIRSIGNIQGKAAEGAAVKKITEDIVAGFLSPSFENMYVNDTAVLVMSDYDTEALAIFNNIIGCIAQNNELPIKLRDIAVSLDTQLTHYNKKINEKSN